LIKLILHSLDRLPTGGLAVKTHRHSSQVTLKKKTEMMMVLMMEFSMQVSEILRPIKVKKVLKMLMKNSLLSFDHYLMS
jgi:hypothetical protein